MASLDELKKMLNQAPCGIGLFEYNGNGNATYLNDTYYQLIGYTREEYAELGESVIPGLMCEMDLHIVPETAREMEQNGAFESEYRITRKDGQVLWIKLGASKMMIEGQNMVFCTFTDISAEKKLTSQLNLIADHVGSSISMIRLESGNEIPLYTNEMFYNMLGVSRQEYALAPSEFNRKAVTEEDWQRVGAAVRKTLKAGKSGSVEYWLQRPDGTRIYVNRNFSVIRQESNGALLLLSIVTDLTKQKQAEAFLQKERSRYRLALEQAHATVFEWDYETNDFYCSESYREYAISHVDNQLILQNKGPLDVIHPDDLPMLQQFFAGAGNPNIRHECILRLKRTDGSYRWSRISGQKTVDEEGKLLRAIGVIMDINDEMEKSLMMNELVSMLPGGVGIFKFTPQMQCLYFNQTMTKLGILTGDEVGQEALPLQQWIENRIFPSDRELFRTEVLSKAVLGEKINCNFRYDRSGNFTGRGIGWIHLSAVKIREESGYPVYYAILSEPSDQSKIFMQISEHSLVAELALEYPSGRILYANQAFCTLADVTDDTMLIGCDCQDILDAREAEVLKKLLCSRSSDETMETELRTSCGKYFNVQAHFLNWNGKDAAMFYFSDQTETKKQNDSLKKMFNCVPSGIGIYEMRDGKVIQLYLNDAFHRMLCDTRENRRKYTGENYLLAIHPDDVPAFRKIIGDLLRGAQTVELTYRVKNGAGKWVWFHLSGNLQTEEEKKLIYCSFFDVDEQMKTQLALKREQTMLSLAMQTAKISSWEYDVCNKSTCRTGVSESRHGHKKEMENVPESLIQSGFVHPDSVEEYRRLFLPAADVNDIKSADVFVKTRDGHTYWWERIFMTPIFDADGKHVRSIGTSIDVTEQKNAEFKYLRQMQELSSADSPDLIAKMLYNLTKNKLESYTTCTNNTFSLRNVVSYDDGLQRTAEHFFKTGEMQNFLQLFDRRQLLRNFARGDTELSMEYQRKAEDGSIFWARTMCKMACAPRGEDVFCFVYSYDINAHKIAQETIHTVIGLDYDYFAVLDCRSNSYTLYAGRADSQQLLPPERSMDYERAVREYAEANLVESDVLRSIHEMSIQNVRAQLQTHKNYISYANLKTTEGEIRRKKLQFSYLDRENEQVLITRMDITDIYRQEQTRLTELRNAAQAVQKANSIKTDFLARMSHDLRTPMNAVIGLTDLAKDELSDPRAMEYYISSINSAGKFLLGLVNDCLDFEKISENRMQLHPTPYSYEAFQQTILTMIAPLCQRKNIEFIFEPSETTYTVQMDAVRLDQIFMNLLTNAVKFTPKGGKVEFLIRNNVRRGDLVSTNFIVRDNGIGMSREFQSRMFEPFEQENNGTTAQSQGTGLGLAIVKRLVDLMQGTISVKSEVGCGTEFTVHLEMPIVDALEAELPDAIPDSDVQLKGCRVLVVEDHPMNTEIARRLLEKKKVHVTCAENGREALEKFQLAEPHTWDAILMDVRMPVMDGLEAACAIRALHREDAKTIPIIAMTANVFQEDVQATRKAGMNAHLIKPIEPQHLYETLSHFIHGADVTNQETALR